MMVEFNITAQLARRAQLADEGAITRVVQRTRALIAEGRDIISLSIGEPDFDTPVAIQTAATRAMAQGFTHYSPVAGLSVLKEAIAAKLRHENELDYRPDEIVVSNGAKQALANAILAVIDPGDEVILLSPYWTAYESQVLFAGGKPVILSASISENYKVPVSRIADALTPKTKLLILNSPSNPSGAVWSPFELKALADVVASHPRLMVLSDEIYEYFIFDGVMTSFASLPGMRERTITVNGLSKSFAMTGWRVGYTAAPPIVTRAIMAMQSTLTSGANSFVQVASAEALKGSRVDVQVMCERYRQRRDRVVAALRGIEGLELGEIPATFYAFPDVSALFGRKAGNRSVASCDEMVDWLLEDHGVALVPGSGFGAPNSLRLSFATGEEALEKALSRLANAFASLT